MFRNCSVSLYLIIISVILLDFPKTYQNWRRGCVEHVGQYLDATYGISATFGVVESEKHFVHHLVTMADILPQFPQFDLLDKNTIGVRWERYVRRFENLITAMALDEEPERKRAMLLYYAGEGVEDIVDSLPAESVESYDDLIEALNERFKPQANVEFERYKFRQTKQAKEESIDQFHVRLIGLAKGCKFHSDVVEIKSQLITGCLDKSLRRQALREPDMTLEKFVQTARAFEASNQQSLQMEQSPEVNVNSVKQARGKGFRNFNKNGKSKQKKECYNCGGTYPHHKDKPCPAKGKQCHFCASIGHFASKCMKKKKAMKTSNTNSVAETGSTKVNVSQVEPNFSSLFELHSSSKMSSSSSIVVPLEMNGHVIDLELDTGSARTLINRRTADQICRNATLDKRDVPHLKTYSGQIIIPLGESKVTVKGGIADKEYDLKVLVVPGDGPNLLGRDWLKHIQLDWKSLFHVMEVPLGKKFPELFAPGMGKLKWDTELQVDDSVSPRFMKARPVSYAMKDKVNKALDNLVSEGILKPVTHSAWAAPIVPVLKKNGSVRICGDYKLTANLALKGNVYPIPNIGDIYDKLTGGVVFSQLDLQQAYFQCPLSEESQEVTVINTEKGLFAYTRLPMGISVAPSVFQQVMDQVVQGIPMCAAYLDDIVVSGRTLEEHNKNLHLVLTRLQDAGLRLCLDKCVFGKQTITYLGHELSAEGIRPTKEKVEAIRAVQVPKNIVELRSFLGLVNFYHSFVQNLSDILAPLNQLLKKDTTWKWTEKQDKAFQKAKTLLQGEPVLMHYNPKLKIILTCDASPYGIGGVLSHMTEEGEKPIAYTSRTLTQAEKNYAHLEREALALVFSVQKFHKYLYGRDFVLRSDHKPLLGLLKEDRAISATASARIQRWALTLANYRYTLEYCPGSRIPHADTLSRCPMKESVKEEDYLDVVLSISILDATPVTAAKIAQATHNDPILSKVKRFILAGWSEDDNCVAEELQPYSSRKAELSVQENCVLWGGRVVVPPSLRENILKLLHEGHPGIVKMKGLARSYVWWPKLDRDIEQAVNLCSACCQARKCAPKAELHPWVWPKIPWHRIHVDYAGPFEGKMILVMVDAHSKYIEAFITNSASTSVTLSKLRQSFATHGIPAVLVSDNGTCFTSDEFAQFCRINGIKHIRSAPFHPATNGLAERAVQTVKEGLKKTSGDLEDRLYRFLSRYRITPHATTGQPPATLLMNRHVRTRLDLVKPNQEATVLDKQEKSKLQHDTSAYNRDIFVGDCVQARNFASGPKWLFGTVEEKTGPVSYTVRLEDGRLWRRHVDHIRTRFPVEPSVPRVVQQRVVEDMAGAVSSPTRLPPNDDVHFDDVPSQIAPSMNSSKGQVDVGPLPSRTPTVISSADVHSPVAVDVPVTIRKSTRVKKTPERFKDFISH